VTCVEKNQNMSDMAKEYCAHMIVGDIESDAVKRQLAAEMFDVITFGDVLEHLRDPAEALNNVRCLIAPGGYLVASIPNVAHRSVRLSLLFGEFNYADMGLLDQTHLRFFTIRTIEKMMKECGFKIVEIVRIRDASLMDTFLRRTASWGQRVLLEIVKVLFRGLIRGEGLTYQFVIKAVPISGV
jgi:2-polyprenyl-3-methyl-5-hydroxy-6-metoxy-1,4-benzoquinol methylase